MKKSIKILSLTLIAVMIMAFLGSCSDSNTVMTIGDRKISRDEYVATAMSIKTQFITDNDLEENDSMWEQYIDSTYTYTTEQYLNSMIQSYLISYNLYAIHFDELGLSLDEQTEAKIKETLDNYIKQYGTKEKLDEALKSQGFTYETFEAQYYNEAKRDAVIMYYFGPDSKESPVSRESMLEYYSEYYTKVKHVFLSTKDKEDNDLSKSEKEKVGEKAKEIYDKAIGGADFDSLIDEYGEDPGMATNPNGYIFSTEDSSYNKMFYNAAFEMKPDEIRLIQTNLGYHIMKKYAFTEEELFSDGNEVDLIENMMSEESADLLDSLKERIGVEYNNSLLESLSVSKLDPVNEGSEGFTTQDIADQLGIEKGDE